MSLGHHSKDTNDAGFTLIELVMVMSIAGVLATIGMFGFANWRNTSEQQGSAQSLVSQLRNSAELAISEGRTHCVDLDPVTGSYSVWRYACSSVTGVKVTGTLRPASTAVGLTAAVTLPSPAPACPASHSCIYFYPRGTATPGSVSVTSSKRSNVYTIHIEGLTARVYM